jgi:hypothetical protein
MMRIGRHSIRIAIIEAQGVRLGFVAVAGGK